ncbi:hypothetical protein JCM3765_005381, partial [Sporobolomyces pararoseus]
MYFVPTPAPSGKKAPSFSPSSSASSPSSPPSSKQTPLSAVFSLIDWKDPLKSIGRILIEPEGYWLVASALVLLESLLVSAVILKIPYTEIDFKTYLQQATLFLSGERDYSLIKGDTGLCVYPAGHLYAYSFLHYFTNAGQSLEHAQWLFGAIYVATLVTIFSIYSTSKRIPPYALIFLTLSKRIHSLYVLRLFNDCLAMFFLYAALWFYLEDKDTRSNSKKRASRWLIGTCLFSVALSIKMSILLFLPALLYLLFVYHSPIVLLQHTVLLLTTQVLLASPFLTSLPLAKSYLTGAFDFNREFLWEWTVNWRWLGVDVFEDPAWGKVLLMAHVAGLGAMAIRWADDEGGAIVVLKRALKSPGASPALHRLTDTRALSFFSTWIWPSASVDPLSHLTRHDFYLLHLQSTWCSLCKVASLPVLRLVLPFSRLASVGDLGRAGHRGDAK